MKLREFFQRKVSCDTLKLKNVITQWLNGEGWKFRNFADFAELIGLETPIHLYDLKEESYEENEGKTFSFRCLTVCNVEVRVMIYFPNMFKDYSQISIRDEKNTKEFGLYSNFQGVSKPRVFLEETVTQKFGKEVNSVYFHFLNHYFEAILKIDDTHTLKVKIEEQREYCLQFKDLVQENWEKIEEYLLTLEKSLQLPEIYYKMKQIFNISDADESRKISMIYADGKGIKKFEI